MTFIKRIFNHKKSYRIFFLESNPIDPVDFYNQKKHNQSVYKFITKNRFIDAHYTIIRKFTAGIVLEGSEVKSIRCNGMNLMTAYCSVINGEVFIFNLPIPEYKYAKFQHSRDRTKKLLLKKSEIKTLFGNARKKGITIVPVEAFFNEKGLIKIVIALAEGKSAHTTKEEKKEKEIKRRIREFFAY